MRTFLLFLLPLLFLACGTASPEGSLSASDFEARLKEPDVQLIDARSAAEFSGGHLASATNLDWNGGALEAAAVNLDKSKPVLVYCASGRRSAAAREFLIDQGFKDVVDLQGGIHAWTAAGKPLGD